MGDSKWNSVNGMSYSFSSRYTHATIPSLLRTAHRRTELISCKTSWNKSWKKCFQKNTEWPASSSDCNARVYHGRFYHPFTKKDELQSKIIKAWWFHKRLERNLQSLETISFEIELLSIETVEHKNFAIFTGKETPRQVFSCKYCEIFKNTYFEEHLRTAA